MSQRASERNVVIVGDWFVAESLVRRAGESGYRQTVFHWHAPTVLAAIQRFDMEFEELAAEAGCCSRDAAVAHIERLLHVHALPAAAPDATPLPRGAPCWVTRRGPLARGDATSERRPAARA